MTYKIATYPANTCTKETHTVTAPNETAMKSAVAAKKAELEAAGHQIVFCWEAK